MRCSILKIAGCFVCFGFFLLYCDRTRGSTGQAVRAVFTYVFNKSIGRIRCGNVSACLCKQFCNLSPALSSIIRGATAHLKVSKIIPLGISTAAASHVRSCSERNCSIWSQLQVSRSCRLIRWAAETVGCRSDLFPLLDFCLFPSLNHTVSFICDLDQLPVMLLKVTGGKKTSRCEMTTPLSFKV